MKLYLSFTAFCYALVAGKAHRFEKNLFFFGCTRPHAMGVPTYSDKLDDTCGELIHHVRHTKKIKSKDSQFPSEAGWVSMVQDIIGEAEREGRISWRPELGTDDALICDRGEELIHMLEKNGFKADRKDWNEAEGIRFNSGHGGDFGRNYPATEATLKMVLPALECIR